MTHKLIKYMQEVDKTHKGLGRLFSFCLLTTKANKVSIIVAVAGSGKTTAITAAADSNPNTSIKFDTITRSGVKSLEKKLNGFKGTFVINDLGNIDTGYSTKESIKTAVALTYEHGLSKLNSQIQVEIENFYGSFITSAQPVIMHNIINGNDWEAVIRDKTIRYYHLKRPISPNSQKIKLKIDWGRELDEVKLKKIESKNYDELWRVGLDQWGLSRTNEHIADLLKAAAALDGRTVVKQIDIDAVLEITRPMRLEKWFIDKQGFESGKEFLGDHMCMLTEFATYKNVRHEQIASNYFITLRTVNRLLSTVRELYFENPMDKMLLMPSELTEKILDEGGYL